ncbi:MAG: hypothetical protein J0L73_27510 [Verrucomicrobia bacterium]|nr:hypothetical protein [Verrucomicrobiota bacterium]
MRSRSIFVESGLLACALGLAGGAVCCALRSDCLSATNGIYVVKMGTVIYVVCRGVSLAPVGAGGSSLLKFFVAALVGAGLLYLHVVWINGIA